MDGTPDESMNGCLYVPITFYGPRCHRQPFLSLSLSGLQCKTTLSRFCSLSHNPILKIRMKFNTRFAIERIRTTTPKNRMALSHMDYGIEVKKLNGSVEHIFFSLSAATSPVRGKNGTSKSWRDFSSLSAILLILPCAIHTVTVVALHHAHCVRLRECVHKLFRCIFVVNCVESL